MINSLYIKEIASSLSLSEWQVEHCIELLEEGATVPFISRYRKERTGALDEVQVAQIRYSYLNYAELDKRKHTILNSIAEQGKLTDELKLKIEECCSSNILEDIYLPYKPKRRTRASVAKENGLEPLAVQMISFELRNVESVAENYLNEQVSDVGAAIAGACDIIAEWVSENGEIREALRSYLSKHSKLVSKIIKGKEDGGEKFLNYFDFGQEVAKVPSHRILAVLRGEDEGFLKIKLECDDQTALRIVNRLFYKGSRCADYTLFRYLDSAVRDAYKRLLFPSIEREVIRGLKERADDDSIKIFGENLRQLLLAPPVGRKRTLAIDPGFRTGCKVVCLDEQGNLLHNDTIYPHPPVNEKIGAMKKLSNLIESYKIEVIAIGNGTASRETEAFIKRISFPHKVNVYSVSEDGASIYSASAVAREEFPEYDVTVRGAISIGRRLMDPLAELVKIDAKSLGVGQYQHDVNQSLLKEKLDDVVVSCVNRVGVNLNTASKHLLSYVSGISSALAQNIVDYRDQNGPYRSRQELLNVNRLGEKVFEQAAGFLRIPDAANPLDNSAVHPESYALVEEMAASVKISVNSLIGNQQAIDSIDRTKFITDDRGLFTIDDILSELAKPGRDPRSVIKVLEFSNDIRSIEDLHAGMELPGIITNITDFGAFVDIGIKEKGLIHVSNLSNRFVKNPAEIVKLHQHVKVSVINIEPKRGRIGLKLISAG